MPSLEKRTLMKHGQCSATIAIPMPYRRYYKLKPGSEVTVVYDSLLLIVPKQLEFLIEEKKELINALLSGHERPQLKEQGSK